MLRLRYTETVLGRVGDVYKKIDIWLLLGIWKVWNVMANIHLLFSNWFVLKSGNWLFPFPCLFYFFKFYLGCVFCTNIIFNWALLQKQNILDSSQIFSNVCRSFLHVIVDFKLKFACLNWNMYPDLIAYLSSIKIT